VKAGVKGAAPGRPADIAATGILLREGWREDPCPDRAVLQGRDVVVKLDQRRKGLADGGDQCTNLLVGIRGQIDVNPARHDAVHHQPVPETGGGSAAKPARARHRISGGDNCRSAAVSAKEFSHGDCNAGPRSTICVSVVWFYQPIIFITPLQPPCCTDSTPVINLGSSEGLR
jgi:hypothetical protein